MTTKLTTTVGAAAVVTALFVGTAPIAEAQPRGYSVGEYNAICQNLTRPGQLTYSWEPYWNGQWLAHQRLMIKFVRWQQIKRRFWPDTWQKVVYEYWESGYPTWTGYKYTECR
ncbi:hypothetical protein [Gordonia bronchialis]|uniref:hypothetical protein n=1 Tax=Gordonia bronchialis TaxID=2054 RepID=UPI00242CE588|nr:hypothetical protein [Gordonia bronchialis]